jgi:hypothetical protein
MHPQSTFGKWAHRRLRREPITQFRNDAAVGQRMVGRVAVARYPARDLRGNAKSEIVGRKKFVSLPRRPHGLYSVDVGAVAIGVEAADEEGNVGGMSRRYAPPLARSRRPTRNVRPLEARMTPFYLRRTRYQARRTRSKSTLWTTWRAPRKMLRLVAPWPRDPVSDSNWRSRHRHWLRHGEAPEQIGQGELGQRFGRNPGVDRRRDHAPSLVGRDAGPLSASSPLPEQGRERRLHAPARGVSAPGDLRARAVVGRAAGQDRPQGWSAFARFARSRISRLVSCCATAT